MARVSVLFIVFLVSFIGTFVRGSSQLPRGASPADSALYAADSSGYFTCRDGLKKILFSRVNDDYCDCEDGSDEPGTSACLQGMFYCANRGDEPKTLRSMYVDDGVCDCCDGTDEPRGTCKDFCLEIGKETLKHVEEELADAKQGLSKRSSLEKTAANTRRSWEKRVTELEKMESAKAQQKAAAEVAKTQAESKLERLKSRLSKLESEKESMKAKSGLQAEDTNAEEGAGDEEKSNLLVKEDEAIPDEEEEEEIPNDQQEVEGGETEATEEEEIEETEEERAKRVASQWIPGQSASDNEINNDEEEVYEPEDLGYNDDDATLETHLEPQSQADTVPEQNNSDFGMIFALKMWLNGRLGWITGKVDIDQKLSQAKANVDAAQKKFDKANDEFHLKQSDLTKLQNEKSDLEKKLATEYGPSNVFLSLAESCVEANIDKYVYKICPFGDAFQGENGRNTRLGTWSGFEENGTVMSFADGEGCWQGPSRSIKVSIRCGSNDIFESVSEPSRCTYTGIVRTPAHCTEELIKSMEKEVARRKHLLNPESPKEEL